MSRFYSAILSKYDHQEGYLDLALQNLVESGKASRSFNEDSADFISILDDDNKNYYLLFQSENLEKVKIELKRRIIRSEGAINFNNVESLIEFVKNNNIHEFIQQEYSQEKIHGLFLD